MPTEIAGPVRVWGLGGERRYVVVDNRFGEARLLYKPDPYSVQTGRGEQRGVLPAHSRAIERAIEAGTFTPTAVHAGVRPRHAKAMQFFSEGDSLKVRLVVEDGDTLPLINGGHRFDAMGRIRQKAQDRLKKSGSDEDREFLGRVDALPITALLLLDGSTQDDFLRLQLGKAVCRSHMLSLQVGRGVLNHKNSQAVEAAFLVARLLCSSVKSPYYKQIRFDSRSMAPIPVKTVCPQESGSLAVSLTGLAKVGISLGRPDPEWLASCVVAAVKALQAYAPDSLEEGKVLTPPPDGSIGSASMLTGLGAMLAYRCLKEKIEPSDQGALMALAKAASASLDLEVGGDFSSQKKRMLIGDFAREYFRDYGDDKHDDIPVELLKLLSASAFAAEPLPRGV